MHWETILLAFMAGLPALLASLAAFVSSLRNSRQLKLLPTVVETTLVSAVAEKVPVFSAVDLAAIRENTERRTGHARNKAGRILELHRLVVELRAAQSGQPAGMLLDAATARPVAGESVRSVGIRADLPPEG